MKLNFARSYKSINSLGEIELSDFSIITGLNGSGKTHLLKAIDEGAIVVSHIDLSEIIYYSYNDFTIHNGDPGVDEAIKQKHTGYLSKTSVFNQKISTERNRALESFIFSLQIENRYFSIDSFNNIVDFDSLIDWSDDDYKLYNAKKQGFDKTNNTYEYFDELKPHQVNFIKLFGVFNDISLSVSAIKEFKTKVDAYHLIKSSGFSRQIINWQWEELSTLLASGNDLFQNHWDINLRTDLSPNLALFLLLLAESPERKPNYDESNLNEMRNAIESMFKEIEEHFVKEINPDTLAIIKGLNESKSILEPIGVESGFLNLHEITIAEKEFQIREKANEYAEFLRQKGKPSYYLTKEEFQHIYGDSPVNMLNQVLNEYDCNGYEFRQTELEYTWGMDISLQDIQVSLYNKIGNYNTTLDSLSSGERTLLALAFTIFKLKRRKVIAKLFLMDEIDSSLHPSMSKRLLNVLYNFFHQQLGINIIMSTHSPSTIAFAPSKSFFLMTRGGEPRLASINRDRALSELTTGVPSFSINYENRRQVFVESPYDAQFYESLYNIYKKHLNAEISLNFISSGDSETNSNGIGIANCDQVTKITNILRASGNKFIWGIIDWDLKTAQSQEDFVKVLGYNHRYSMENYLLDPLLVAIFLWREKIVEPSFFGFENEKKIYEIFNLDATKLQIMIDAVIVKLNEAVDESSQIITSYELVSNIELKIPKWFCNNQGHELEKKYLLAFPKLNEIKRNKEAALKQSIIDKAIADFPEYAPKDLLEVLKQVQEI